MRITRKRVALVLPPLLLAAALAGPGWAGSPATTELVSVSSTGQQGTDQSASPSISANGRFVAFESDAPNLVPGDTNGKRDVFVRDFTTNQTQRVSVSSAGVQGNKHSRHASISANGRFVAFASDAHNLVPNDTNGVTDVFVSDLKKHTIRRVTVSSAGTQANDASYGLAISGGGRFVAFDSFASNLVPGDTNHVPDVFVRDLK